MKLIFTLALCFSLLLTTAQTPITAVNTNSVSSPTSYTYTSGGNTYKWAVDPYNATVYLNGFTAGSVNYSVVPSLSGSVQLRRTDNAGTTGNFTLVWSQGNLVGQQINLFTSYENNMENLMNNRIYNQGADNFFDNVAPNSNNIERLDYLLAAGFSTPVPDKYGIPVFDRGDVGGHDPFVIAAITAVDAFGNPSGYGNILRVTNAGYGDPGPNIAFRILKAQYPDDLIEVGSNTQSRGGTFISLQALGVAANQTIYGYSILANDLPGSATSANLVDWTNTTYFPTNTGFSGGIDMAAVVGLFVDNVVLPTRFTIFNANNNNAAVNLQWSVENDNTVDHYEIERSEDGIDFTKIQSVPGSGSSAGNRSYQLTDNITDVTAEIIFYRIKMYDKDGSFTYSKIVSVKVTGFNSAFRMYPNPVKNNLFLNIRHNANSKVRISIINTEGQKVLRQNQNIVNGNNSLSLDGVERLSKGTYILNINIEGGKRIVRRFQKQ
jgi:hypothetical protein